MTQIVLLDSTPVGLITNPKATPLAVENIYLYLLMLETGRMSKWQFTQTLLK
jgi:hypothetical protein